MHEMGPHQSRAEVDAAAVHEGSARGVRQPLITMCFSLKRVLELFKNIWLCLRGFSGIIPRRFHVFAAKLVSFRLPMFDVRRSMTGDVGHVAVLKRT